MSASVQMTLLMFQSYVEEKFLFKTIGDGPIFVRCSKDLFRVIPMTSNSGRCFQPFVGLSLVQLFVILLFLFKQDQINLDRIKTQAKRDFPHPMNCSGLIRSNSSIFYRAKKLIFNRFLQWYYSNNISCSLDSNGLGPLPIDQLLISKNLSDALKNVENGGVWCPQHCRPREKLVVIVPYRNRSDLNLETFLLYMHFFLQRQLLDYRILVVEQSGNASFNRGMLLNIGFREAVEMQQVDCVIFHDVDLLPENDKNVYRCGPMPRHMSVAVSTLNYALPYRNLFGGVEAFKSTQFIDINGFSNMYFGWGGEDDDLFNRVNFHQMEVTRYPMEVARYKMLQHRKESPSPKRLKLLKNGMMRLKSDGLSSLSYRCLKVEERPLYTWISVDLDSFFNGISHLSDNKTAEKMYGKNESLGFGQVGTRTWFS